MLGFITGVRYVVGQEAISESSECAGFVSELLLSRDRYPE
jgi:hypothetical protein